MLIPDVPGVRENRKAMGKNCLKFKISRVETSPKVSGSRLLMKPLNPRPRRSKILLVFASIVLLIFDGACIAAQAPAPGQALAQAQADEPSPQPIVPVVFQNPISPDQLAFLKDYSGQSAKALQKDKRFRSLMKLVVPRTEYHYGRDMALSETVEVLLDGTAAPTAIRDGRYVMVSSAGGKILRGKGFVWFDLEDGIALGGVYFHPTNGEPTPTLAIYSRQLKDISLSMNQLPEAFQQDLARWILETKPRFISPRYFIPENGKKYVLVHDEDYCSYAEGAPPPQDKCEQLNSEAADADVNAAYFMEQTHNAANATAWMLGPDQIAWVEFRDRSCGLVLACRIRVSRQRMRALMRTRRN